MTRIPATLSDPAVLAFLAQITAWREGDEIPPMPDGVTKESLPELIGLLDDPAVRKAVVLRLSVLVPSPNRKLRRRGKGHGKGHSVR